MSCHTFRHFNDFGITYDQKVKILKQLATPAQTRSFSMAASAYNMMNPEDQYAGDGINGGCDGVRVDISVDPRRPVIHVEVDGLGDHPRFFRCEIGGDIVIQEVAL